MSSGGPGGIPFETRRIEVGGDTVAVDLWGDPGNPTVLLLHGIPGWRGIWRAVGPRMVRDAFVVAPDLLGFGESSEPPEGAHAADQAAVIVALIRHLGGRPVHLVGFDFGGPVAVMVCREAPELVASLTLAATNVFTDTPIPPPLQLVRPPVIGDLFARVVFSKSGLSLMWFAAVAKRQRFPFARYRDLLRFPGGVRWTRKIFQASLRDLPGLYAPVQNTLSTIRVPCTVLWGDRDPFFPVAVGERCANAVTGARFVTLRGCGHFLPEEDPERFAGAVLASLRQAAFGRRR